MRQPVRLNRPIEPPSPHLSRVHNLWADFRRFDRRNCFPTTRNVSTSVPFRCPALSAMPAITSALFPFLIHFIVIFFFLAHPFCFLALRSAEKLPSPENSSIGGCACLWPRRRSFSCSGAAPIGGTR